MKKLFCMSVLVFATFTTGCKKKNNETVNTTKETYSSGEQTVWVEESIAPIFGALSEVFQSHYPDAKLTMKVSSENKILAGITADSFSIAFLPTKLTEKQLNFFEGKVVPKQTAIAKDAIVFITNKKNNDSLINYLDVIEHLKNTKATSRRYVLENINANISTRIRKETGITANTDKAIFLPTTTDVIDYISKTENTIGIVGLNWLIESDFLKKSDARVKSLAVYNPKDHKYYKATQSNIAENLYPLIREIYVLDFQGKQGLGKGFASFAASDIGQRVVLKSGLMPIKLPHREITINGSTENN